ncbi:Ras Guanyl-Releasing Protein 3 [Manis pentadactyla]|nr:Ras Guanyl-Releasing Protein 3 [Manis pentadactyla]
MWLIKFAIYGDISIRNVENESVIRADGRKAINEEALEIFYIKNDEARRGHTRPHAPPAAAGNSSVPAPLLLPPRSLSRSVCPGVTVRAAGPCGAVRVALCVATALARGPGLVLPRSRCTRASFLEPVTHEVLSTSTPSKHSSNEVEAAEKSEPGD